MVEELTQAPYVDRALLRADPTAVQGQGVAGRITSGPERPLPIWEGFKEAIGDAWHTPMHVTVVNMKG